MADERDDPVGENRDADPGTIDAFLPLVYDELHALADACMRRERRGHTLQPTALIHEVYLRLARQKATIWRNRSQFLAVAAQAMRRILVDSARGHRRAKRGGGRSRVPFHELVLVAEAPRVDIIALDEALTRLASIRADHARLVELRFFGGFSIDEVAEMMGISTSTANRDWRCARAWLFRHLSPGGREAGDESADARRP